jgi:hypothetical protein
MMKSLLGVFVAVSFFVPQSVVAEQRLERSGPERSGPERSSGPNSGQRQEQRRENGQKLDTRPRQDVVRERRQETTTPQRETRPKQEIRQERRKQETTTTTKQQLTTTPKESSKGLKAVSGNQGRVVIKGQNYTVWKGEHRVRVGNRFRRFGPLVLGAVLLSGVSYYPYAYLSAPEPVCDGLTDDGFLLRWVEVRTLDGDLVYQCVAFAVR